MAMTSQTCASISGMDVFETNLAMYSVDVTLVVFLARL